MFERDDCKAEGAAAWEALSFTWVPKKLGPRFNPTEDGQSEDDKGLDLAYFSAREEATDEPMVAIPPSGSLALPFVFFLYALRSKGRSPSKLQRFWVEGALYITIRSHRKRHRDFIVPTTRNT